jgi:chromosome segregation ATPase
MLRIFLILSLAVALAGLGFSFVLKTKVEALSAPRDEFGTQRDNAIASESRARDAERRAREAEKAAKDELELTQQELTTATARLAQTEQRLAQTSQELEETRIARDTAQRRLARWEALEIEPDAIAALKAEAARLTAARDALEEEKKVMSREIVRLNDELDIYRGRSAEVQMADLRGRVTGVNENFDFVTINIGADDGAKRNGKMIITRGDELVAKVQLVRVDANQSVGNLLPGWKSASVQPGDIAMTSYEALPR